MSAPSGRRFWPWRSAGRNIEVILVTELTRWGRSMLDLLVAQTGLQFDLRSAQGKLIASLRAALAEFEGGSS